MKSEAQKVAARRYAAAYHKQLRAKRKAAGLCQSCGNAPATTTYCIPCRESKNALQRTAVATKKSLGLCRCGRDLRAGRHSCQVCHDTMPSKKHGLSRIEAGRLLAEQQGTCKLCGVLCDRTIGSDRPHVDHCHATGRVRGVVCQRCNIQIGGFEAIARRGLLSKLAEYILQ